MQAYLGILQNQYDFGEVIEIKFPNKDRDIEQAAIVFKSGVEVSLLPTQVAARESAKNIEAYVNQWKERPLGNLFDKLSQVCTFM